MKRDKNGAHTFLEFNPAWPDCMCCRDTGIVGGDTYEFRFCLCPAGERKKLTEPEAVNEANRIREKLFA